MTYAWEWTHDRKYLEHAVLLFRSYGPYSRSREQTATFLVEAPEGALYEETRLFPRDSHAMFSYRFELPFLKLLHDLDLLRQFEPPQVDLSGVEFDRKARSKR
jgi:hypothetical protein